MCGIVWRPVPISDPAIIENLNNSRTEGWGAETIAISLGLGTQEPRTPGARGLGLGSYHGLRHWAVQSWQGAGGNRH